MQEILWANYDGDSLHFQCGDQKVLRTGPWKWKVLHDLDWASHLLCPLSPGLCWISSHVSEQAEFGERSRTWAKAKMAAEHLFVFPLQQTPAWMVSLWGTNSEWILKGTKGKKSSSWFNLKVLAQSRRACVHHQRWSSTWNSLQFQSEAEVWGLQLPAQAREDDLKDLKFKTRAVHEFHVLRTLWFRLVYGALRNISCFSQKKWPLDQLQFPLMVAHPSSTSAWCPKCKEPLQTSFRVPKSVSYSSGRVRCQSEPWSTVALSLQLHATSTASVWTHAGFRAEPHRDEFA